MNTAQGQRREIAKRGSPREEQEEGGRRRSTSIRNVSKGGKEGGDVELTQLQGKLQVQDISVTVTSFLFAVTLNPQ